MLWNNQPDREAFGLVRKGVGQSTVLRAVETPYPKVNPIQSNPGISFKSGTFDTLVYFLGVLRAVETPYLKVNPIQSNIGILATSISMSGKFCHL